MDVFKRICKTLITVGGIGLMAAELTEGPRKIRQIWAKQEEEA
jgi:hypothetical protein